MQIPGYTLCRQNYMDDILDYFQQHYKIEHPGEITWAHAVNITSLLKETLKDEAIMFVESDISQLANGTIVAAHSPTDTSDLSFEELIQEMRSTSKGLKLDFKNQASVLPCLNQLASSALTQPVILNADILNLVDAPEAEVNPKIFIKSCEKIFNKGLMSLGWRTTGHPESIYTANDIDNMLSVCNSLKEVTFPVRASMLPKSWKQVQRLIKVPNYTLTIWNSEPVDKGLNDWIKTNTDPNLCFYDLSI